MTLAEPFMPVASTVTPPGDRRYKLILVAIKRHQHRADALIEILHCAQQAFGYLDRDLLGWIARQLRLPPSRVYGVATFYHLFTLRPPGRHTCVVCIGTACYVQGAGAILNAIERAAEIRPGETTDDGEISLVTARCVGACGTAPVVVWDGRLRGHQSVDCVTEQWKVWSTNGSVTIE